MYCKNALPHASAVPKNAHVLQKCITFGRFRDIPPIYNANLHYMPPGAEMPSEQTAFLHDIRPLPRLPRPLSRRPGRRADPSSHARQKAGSPCRSIGARSAESRCAAWTRPRTHHRRPARRADPSASAQSSRRGRLTPVLSHHLACGSALGGSKRLTKFQIARKQAFQPFRFPIGSRKGII